MVNIPQFVDDILDDVQALLMSLLVKLGPFCVALMPALFTAYAIFKTFASEAGTELAFGFALVVGVAIETVGIVSVHTAIDLYNAWQEEVTQEVKFWLMAALIPVYVVGVACVVGFSENAFTPLIKGLGIASPFLTCVVYVAVALARDIRRTKARQEETQAKQERIEAEERAWDREKERLELEHKHAEKMARIEAKANPASAYQGVAQQNGSPPAGDNHHPFDTINQGREERKQLLLASLLNIYTEDPHAGPSSVARQLRVSRQTVYNYLDELEEAGKISRNNGDGVTVHS
jgi:biotin operon repressor/cell division protein FtsL